MATLSFNSRNNTPEEIARKFIIPKNIERISRFQNTVLIGPRGIGKTTILKVLTASGLVELSSRLDVADYIDLNLVDYTPVYIPAESIWKGISDTIVDEFKENSQSDLILNGIFTYHCLHRIISSLEEVKKLYKDNRDRRGMGWLFSISDSAEHNISLELSEGWGLSKKCKSFLGLKIEIIKRANSYREAVSSMSGLQNINSLEKVSFLGFVKIFLDVCESILERKKWVFSFDEMEIAPSKVLAYLYENLRSYDQRVAFKFSLFPVADFYAIEEYEAKKVNSPLPGQDYDTVILANKFKSIDLKFSDDIVRNECISSGIEYEPFIEYLNSSAAIWGRVYTPGDIKAQRSFADIYKLLLEVGDNGYIDHLKRRGFQDLDSINKPVKENKRAELRKVAPLGELRGYYLRRDPSGEGLVRVSSKGWGYYHGYDQMLSICEGNPRALKFMLADLFDAFSRGRNSEAAQNDAIPRNVNRFRALIASQTASAFGRLLRRETIKSTLQVIDSMGTYLSDGILSKDFKSQPFLSFEIKNPDMELRSAVLNGINSGALVLDDSDDASGVIFSVDGARVRISYRLAPYYHLPTITGSSKTISRSPVGERAISKQPDLLEWRSLDV